MTFEYMPDFVTDNAKQLIIIHDIHKWRKYTYTSVRTRKSIDISYMIYFEIQRNTIGISNTFSKFPEALHVRIIFGQHRIMLIHPVHRLLDVLSHLFIRKSKRFYGFCSSTYSFLYVELCIGRGDNDKKHHYHENFKNHFFHIIYNFIFLLLQK